jgi:hypothetical protein
MSTWRSWLSLAIILAVLLGGCTAMAGDLAHWPGSLSAGFIMVLGKLANDRVRLLKWPMEFAFWSAILFIVCNLTWLHFKPF